jgi:hypothetical protein
LATTAARAAGTKVEGVVPTRTAFEKEIYTHKSSTHRGYGHLIQQLTFRAVVTFVFSSDGLMYTICVATSMTAKVVAPEVALSPI